MKTSKNSWERTGLRPVTFVSYEHLVELKRQAGRPQDLDDIAKLQAVRQPPPT